MTKAKGRSSSNGLDIIMYKNRYSHLDILVGWESDFLHILMPYDNRKSHCLMHYGQFPIHKYKITGKERTDFSSHIL